MILLRSGLHILFFFNGIFVFAVNLLGPLYAVYVSGIGGGIFTISLTWSIFILSSTAFMLVVAKFGEHPTYLWHMLSAAFLIRAIVWFSYIFITTIPILIAVQILLGMGEALGSPAFLALFSKHISREYKVRDSSAWLVIANLATALGALAGGLVVSAYGFKMLFITMAVLAAASCIGTEFQIMKKRQRE